MRSIAPRPCGGGLWEDKEESCRSGLPLLGLLHTHIHLVGFENRRAEGFRTRNAAEPEGFDVAELENQVAGVVPALARQHFDLDLVEAVEIDGFVFCHLPAF